MSCGVGRRRGLDPVLLWLWHRPAAMALIQPLAWEPPYAMGMAQKNRKKTTKKEIGVFRIVCSDGGDGGSRRRQSGSYGPVFRWVESLLEREGIMQNMEVPRLGVKSELQLPAHATATATPVPSHVCNLHYMFLICKG